MYPAPSLDLRALTSYLMIYIYLCSLYIFPYLAAGTVPFERLHFILRIDHSIKPSCLGEHGVRTGPRGGSLPYLPTFRQRDKGETMHRAR